MGYIKNPSDNGQSWRESAANDSASIWHGFDSKNNGKDKFFKSETLPNGTKALSESGSIASSGNRLLAGVYGNQSSLPASLWTPNNITTSAWFDASDASTITESANKVSQWDDKSGNSKHAVQATGSQQPTYKPTDANMNGMGSIGVTSNTGAKGLEVPSFGAKICYTVIRNDNANFSSFDVLLAGALDRYLVRGSSGTPDFYTIGTLEFNDFTYKNGSTVSTALNVLPMPTATIFKFESAAIREQTWSFGFGNQWAGNNRTWDGAYSEFIFTDGTEDLSTQQKIEGYLAWKWGTEASLPVSHPYKSAPPYIDAY
jgi:hypothetical protein